MVLSFKLSRRKNQLNTKELSRTLGLEIVDAGSPLQERRALSLEPGDGRGAVWRELLIGNEIFCLGMQAKEATHRKGAWGWGGIPRIHSLPSFHESPAGLSPVAEPREPGSWLAPAASWAAQHRGRAGPSGSRSGQKLSMAPAKPAGGSRKAQKLDVLSPQCFLLITCLWANSFPL